VTEAQRIIGEELVEKQGWAKRALARYLVEKYPSVFPEVDSTRDKIRYQMGTRGHQFRMQRFNFSIPKSVGDKWAFRQLPKEWKRTLVLADPHCPQHDIEALEIAIKTAKERKVDSVYWNGDVCDMYMLSRFIQNPGMPSMERELSCVRQLFRYTSQKLDVKNWWKCANHERRLAHYIWAKAPALNDSVALADLLDMDDEVKVIVDDNLMKYGKLTLIHGDELGKGFSTLVSPARSIFLKMGIHVMGAHYHKSSFFSYKRGDDDGVSTWTTGCLQILHPEYARINQWNHGFAILEKDASGNFSVENYRIEKGKAFLT